MASRSSFTGSWRRVALGQKFQKAMKGWVLVVAAPMCRKTQVARSYPVSQFAINQTGKTGADIGFHYEADPEPHTGQAFDDAPTDVVALYLRPITRQRELRNQDVFKFVSRIILAQQHCLIPKLGPQNDISRRQGMILWQGNQDPLAPEWKGLTFGKMRSAGHDENVECSVSLRSRQARSRSLDGDEFDMRKVYLKIEQRRTQVPRRKRRAEAYRQSTGFSAPACFCARDERINLLQDYSCRPEKLASLRRGLHASARSLEHDDANRVFKLADTSA